MSETIDIKLDFYGRLQSQFGQQPHTPINPGDDVKTIYLALCEAHQQADESRVIKPIINDAFCDWQDQPQAGDTLGFFPPASGG